MGRARNRNRRPARRAHAREPKRRLLVLCEGLVTEPQYIRGLERVARNATIEITIPNEQGDPKRLVELAKEKKREADRRARQERDDLLRFDEVWCVCDVDQHDRLPDARQMARDNDIELVVSNPCFELWLLLHFRDHPGAQHRSHVQHMLKIYLTGYAKRIEFGLLKDRVDDAIERSSRLHQLAAADGEPGRNPSTDVFRLVQTIRREDP